MAQLRPLLPHASTLRGVRDVCVGGGAFFFCLYPTVRPAFLSDINPDLVAFYKVVRSAPQAFLAELERLRAPFLAAKTWGEYDATYFALRDIPTVGLGPVQLAARLLAVNKTCHNGLTRHNKAGKFNVGPGHRGSTTKKPGPVVVPVFVDTANFWRVVAALDGVDIQCLDVEAAIDAAEEGELVYVDPPYWPASETGFTAYVADGFSDRDQKRVAEAARRAADRGVFVAISNHDLPATRALYKGFHITTLDVNHAISAKAKTRGTVPELLARTFL